MRSIEHIKGLIHTPLEQKVHGNLHHVYIYTSQACTLY